MAGVWTEPVGRPSAPPPLPLPGTSRRLHLVTTREREMRRERGKPANLTASLKSGYREGGEAHVLRAFPVELYQCVAEEPHMCLYTLGTL
jgi:hypothetical protein